MSNIAVTQQPLRAAVRRYLFWIRYDGSRFPEMARGGTGFGVMDLLQQSVIDLVYGCRPHCSNIDGASQIKLSPSSRTDAHVHAIRSSVICQIPLAEADLDITRQRKDEVVRYLNNTLQLANGGGLSVLDVHSVSAGFCIRRSVEYRRYTYRVAVARNWGIWDSVKEDPSTVCFSEQHYAWRLPPGFCVERARDACKLFEGHQIMGSFFKHTEREKRKEPIGPNAVKNLWTVEITGGEAYCIPNDVYDYYNVSIVSKSFVREQIRRMMSCIVYHAYNRLPLNDIRWLLENPISSNFYDRRIPIAPPNGLFLTDVVYDPKNFIDPNPYYKHSWDYDLKSFN